MKTPQNILFTEVQVQRAVDEVSQAILIWLDETKAQGLNLVSVLEGAKPFTRDLMDRLQKSRPGLDLRLHEVRVKATEGIRLLTERQWQMGHLEGKDLWLYPILLVDDLVDSGVTLLALKGAITAQGHKEVRTAVMVRKFGAQSGPVDFCGLELNWDHQTLAKRGLKDCWLFGYGMDNDGQYRDLRHIEGLDIPLVP